MLITSKVERNFKIGRNVWKAEIKLRKKIYTGLRKSAYFRNCVNYTTVQKMR